MFERRLCRRNRFLGGGSEGGRSPPPSCLSVAGDPRVQAILDRARVEIAGARSTTDLEQVRVRVLGRSGELTGLLRSLGALPAAERPRVGQQANQAKVEIEALIADKLAALKRAEREQALAAERLDATLPGRRVPPGPVHPVTRVQVEGLAVDRQVTMADLKATLELFAQQMFGPRSRLRFRPSFFPFTEPSAEADVFCFLCDGVGCRACTDGWLEILGSGMVHPNVLRNVGYDPEEVTGWAFGMGVDRVAMLKYGIADIRLLFENDLRFLQQFAPPLTPPSHQRGAGDGASLSPDGEKGHGNGER